MKMNPIVFFLLLWGICLVLINISPIQFNELSSTFYNVFILSIVFFIIGYYSYFIVFQNKIIIDSKKVFIKKNHIIFLQFFLVITLILLTFLNVYLMTGSFFNLSYYRYIITELSSGSFINKLTPLFIPIVFVGMPILIYIKAEKKIIIYYSFLLLFYFIISGSRSMLIVSILILIWFLYFYNKLKIIHIIISIIFLVFSFSILGFLLGKLSLEENFLNHFFYYIDNDIPRNFFTLSVIAVLKYMLGGIVAFSELTKIYAPSYDFNLVLLNVSKFSSFLGFSPNITTIEYVEVPYRTNVYTWYYNSYLDFGYFGIVFTFFILGLIGSFLFTNYKKNSIFIIYLSVYYAIITLSVFHDYWYSSLFPYTALVYLMIIKKLYFIRS